MQTTRSLTMLILYNLHIRYDRSIKYFFFKLQFQYLLNQGQNVHAMLNGAKRITKISIVSVMSEIK
jgi:hypothetical protein